MAPSTIRKAIGAVKDQTSIGIAKVASNMAPELEVAIVKATSHDDEPANEKYMREILHLTSYSRSHVSACMVTISKRLCKTRDWIVALKSLIVIHRLLSDGEPIFQQEIMYATRRGTRLLNMSDFRDEAHSNSWDHSAFVRTYALYLDQRLELLMYERKMNSGGGGDRDRDSFERSGSREERWKSPSRGYDDRETTAAAAEVRETPLREMTPERMFGKMAHLQRLLDRFLACRPTGLARNSRMVLVTLYPLVKESFKLYADVCEVLAVLLDRFFDMEYSDCVRAFDAYASAGKQIDELVGFYNWCKDTGLARSSEYPEVQRITSKLLDTLEEFVRDRSKAVKTPDRRPEEVPVVEPEPVQEPDMNEIKALPAPERFEEPPRQQEVEIPKKTVVTGDLVDLREEAATADAQGNRLALALFAGPTEGSGNGSWEAFPSEGGVGVTSAWQNPAAEPGKADWELALVETASNLSKQKATLGGGFDKLVLNGMYDQGLVTQYTGAANAGGGSASSVALPPPGAGKGAVLALPAPDGSGGVVAVGGDPFAASASIPPPSYVQMADMEKKQQLLVQEQGVWQQYANQGMQGQTSLARIGGIGGGYYVPGVQQPVMPYGMPPPTNGYYYGATL